MSDAKFWDVRAEAYAAKPIGNMAAYEATLDKVRQYLKPEMKVLEIGAGTGTSALKLSDAVHAITVTDYSANMVKIGEGKARAAGVENLTFQQGEVSDFAKDTTRYDAVMAFNFLHLTRDLHATLSDVNTVLRPGGLFISKSATISGKYAVLRPIVALMRLIGKAPQLNAFSAQKLMDTFAETGFEIVECVRIPENSMNIFVIARKKTA